jgi:YHS domain-containing protein/predicted small lipoprotein YifL
MFSPYRVVSWVAVLGLIVALSGCGSKAQQEKPKTPPTEKSAPAKATDQTGPADAPEGLAQLSAEDRAAAEKQRVCPVSGDVLGAMDKPYKVTVKGQTVFLCCQGCEAQLLKDPDKYLAKLKGTKPK